MRNPFSRKCRTNIVLILIIVSICIIFSSCSPKPYSPPERTAWAPEGPRTVPYIGDASDPAGGDVLGNPAGYFRTLHGDSLNSDEVAIAAAPVFEQDWVAEPHTFNPTGPTFDKSGNVYFAPRFSPEEDVILISLDPNDGSRRWAITGGPRGSGGPLILDDPDNPGEQIIYVGSYDRAVAVKPDADTNLNKVVETGEMVWGVATGLTATPGEDPPSVFGLNYDPTTDTLIGLTADNHMYVLDRKSGDLLLSSPYSLLDIAPSPANPVNIPDFIKPKVEQLAKPLLGETSVNYLIEIIMGNNFMVANYFSVDPHTGKIWVAATAPDGEDGAVDGVSKFGALYCLKLISAGGLYTVDNLFHISFLGGTASTPALSADGQRVYVGDNFGKLLAIDASDGSIIWKLDLGEQISGSISVASDNGELYCVTTSPIIKVIDNGTSATESWRSTLDMYPKIGSSVNGNNITATICANGIAFQASSQIIYGPANYGLTISVGCGLLDRETGKIRYFAEEREESVSVTSIGPDGSIYIAHSPVRRLYSSALFGKMVPSVTGGIQKLSAKRLDLLIRDAVHAAADRANNVAVNGGSWSIELKNVEVKQIGMLIDQCRAASLKAIADGDLTVAQWEAIEGYLNNAESALATLEFAAAYQALQNADNLL